MQNETLKKFLKLAETAGVIFIDHGPALTSWELETEPRVRFAARYVDDAGVGYECELTGEDISEGAFTDGCFRGRDSEGYEVRIEFHRLTDMLRQDSAPVLAEIKGGNIQRVYCDGADELICVDRDMDGVPAESIHTIGGEDALVFIEELRPMEEGQRMLREAMSALGV